MKPLIKSTLAGLLLSGLAMTAQAKDEKTDALANKIVLEMTQELMSQHNTNGKEPSDEEVGRLFLKKMHDHLGEFRETMHEDCVQEYGKDKESQCKCATGKLDYEASFALMEKQLNDASPAEIEKESKAIIKNEKAVYESCGLEYHEETE